MVYAGKFKILSIRLVLFPSGSTRIVLTLSLVDLQASNVYFRIEDNTILKEFEEAELSSPITRKVNKDRVIYKFRGLKLAQRHGCPVLCNFGEARFGSKTYTNEIQLYIYRALEIILNIPWFYSTDIWNLGVLVSLLSANAQYELWNYSDWRLIIGLGYVRE